MLVHSSSFHLLIIIVLHLETPDLFQPVVQPALGILMIGTIVGGFANDEDEEFQ